MAIFIVLENNELHEFRTNCTNSPIGINLLVNIMIYSFAILKPKFSKRQRNIYGIFFFVIYITLVLTIGFFVLPIFENIADSFLRKTLLISYFLGFALLLKTIYSKIIDDFYILGSIDFTTDNILIKEQCNEQIIEIDNIKRIELIFSLGLTRNTKSGKSYLMHIKTKHNGSINLEVSRNEYLNGKFSKSFIFNRKKDLFDVLKVLKIKVDI